MKRKRKAILSASILSVIAIVLIAAVAVFGNNNVVNVAGSGSDANNSEIMTADIPAKAGSLQIEMTLASEKMEFYCNVYNLYIAFGDSTPVLMEGDYNSNRGTYKYSAYPNEDTIKIYSPNAITSFDTNYTMKLTSLDTSNCPNLEVLECGNANLPSLDVSKNTALIELRCDYNRLTSLDVTNNVALKSLMCGGDNNHFTELDLSKNTALELLNYGSTMDNFPLDISHNIALTYLDLSWSNFTEIDVSKNVNLETLLIATTPLTEIDLSNNPALEYLQCSNSQLTAINVSNNPALKTLYCNDNQLTALDVSNNPALESLECNNNQITALDVSNNTNLNYLYCNNNYLKFSTLKASVLDYDWGYYYSPQAKISIASSIKGGETIDLSSEYQVYGENTVYTWYEVSNTATDGIATIADDTVVTPTKSENGVFTFGNEFAGKTLYCTMTNAAFPDLTLTSTNVAVEANGETPDDNPDDTPDDNPDDNSGTDTPGTGESSTPTNIAIILVILSTVSIATVLICKRKRVTFAK